MVISQIEQLFVYWIFPDHIHGRSREIVGDGGPGGSAVFTAIDIGRKIVPTVSVKGSINPVFVMSRSDNTAYPKVLGQGLRNVFPVAPAIVATVYFTIVATGV